MSKRYVAIFCFSFVILSLQIVLSLLLDVIAYIPFIAISFSFFGLSLAGVYTFIKYYSQGQKSKNYLPIRQMILGGTHIIISLAVLYYYNQFAIEVLEKIGSGQLKTTLNYLRLHIIFCSTLAGVLFSIAFFQFGTIVCLLYKENSDQSPKFYLFDLCGAAMGCIFTVIILNLLQVGSVLIFLASTVFALSWYLRPCTIWRENRWEI